ncbi:interferon a3-like [Brienomyrus brachyistius]|uniref:interferon a3-like n=1 Tax=Brienomyrus brachyistius TaxID=42636 RepID=UPI0020B2D647|nr:interferon a3-like [Brienomyrus brachyistius]
MIMMTLFRACLILHLIFGYSTCMSCTRTKNILGIRNEEIKKSLERMGGRFQSECINENPGQMLDDTVYNFDETPNESTRLSMAYEALKSVENIFEKNLSSTTWDRDELHLFQNMIHQTVKKLQICVGEQLSGSSETKYANLKIYFEKLNGILEDKEHSRCAWEIVRMEMLRHLEYLSKFFGSSQYRR